MQQAIIDGGMFLKTAGIQLECHAFCKILVSTVTHHTYQPWPFSAAWDDWKTLDLESIACTVKEASHAE